ncbi:MAG: hypothetical protein MJE77_23020 [Proteobacteria bacterium]|nr:hypothetical protein [Pseudomonadota bacterium]
MRTISWDIVVDTCLFSPLGLQPRALFSHSWNGLARWFKAHVVSFPKLLGDKRYGMVFLGIHLSYDQPLGFFDADTVRVDASVSLLRRGSRVRLQTEFFAADRRAAEMSFLLCPVAIDDGVSLAARPAAFPESIQEYFLPDERGEQSPPRVVPDLVSTIAARGRELASGSQPFFVHRHYGEVADQWSFTEIPCICESARESLALARHEDVPVLRHGLSKPLRSIDVELQRPYFVFDSGRVDTETYDVDGRLAMIHKLCSSQPGGQLHGTVVERF